MDGYSDSDCLRTDRRLSACDCERAKCKSAAIDSESDADRAPVVVGGCVPGLRDRDGKRNSRSRDSNGKLPTYLRLESMDVIHSFWVPQLAGKMDLIPNRINYMWIDPREPGIYLGNCAEYCGTQHANMFIRVIAQAPNDFHRWAAEQTEARMHADPGVERCKGGFRKLGLRELPRRQRHLGHWQVWSRSDASDESSDSSCRRIGEHGSESSRLGQ